MGLKVDFDEAASEGYMLVKENPFVLCITSSERGFDICSSYDFLTRTVKTYNDSGAESIAVTPFSQIDRDTLETLHEEFIKIGGNPPELPPRPETQNFGAVGKDRITRNTPNQ